MVSYQAIILLGGKCRCFVFAYLGIWHYSCHPRGEFVKTCGLECTYESSPQPYKCDFLLHWPVRPCGLMDKASASGAGDCGFESHQGRIFIPFFFFFSNKFLLFYNYNLAQIFLLILSHKSIFFFRCLFRVLDSFGTEPQFNYKTWKPPNRKKGDYGQAWGNWNFNPRQFLTMYRKQKNK